MKIEHRTFAFEMRAAEGDSPKIVGHAALFNTEADLGYFVEVLEPGAFQASIKADDVRALFNHDANYVLGRNVAGTLQLSEDKRGLAIEIDPPDTQWARDLLISMKRGDITQMSFAFIAKDERIEKKDGKLYRYVTVAQLFDVCPVTYPAYTATECAVRSAQEIFTDIEAGQRAAEAAAVLKEVPSEQIPATQPEPESVDYAAILEVQRKRLQLIG